MKRRSKLRVVSSMAAIACCLAMPAIAQTADEEDSASSDDVSVQDTIIVTGVKGSLGRSADIKRTSTSFVDAVTAEDVGKLPDRNVAEALQRIPGVAIQRNRGEGDFVSIRGLGPEFVRGTVNGRTLLSATNAFNSTLSGGVVNQSGRESNFDLLPSEIIDRLIVEKTASADNVEGGIAGTVDVQTARPLSIGNLYAGSLRGRYSEFADSTDFGGSALASWTNSSETFGGLVTVAFSDRTIRNDIAEGFAYSPDSTFAGNTVYDTNGDGTGDADNPVFPFSSNLSTFDEERQRFTVGTTLQWAPDADTDWVFDFLYTKRELEHLEFQSIFLTQGAFVGANLGAANPDGSIPFPSLELDANGNVASYDVSLTGFPENVTDVQRGDDENIVAGLNFSKKYGVWDFEADLSYSKAEGSLEFLRAVYVPTFSYGGSVNIGEFIEFTPDATAAALLSDPANFVTRNIGTDLTDNSDEELAFRFDVTLDDQLSFGVRYSERDRSSLRDRFGGTPAVSGFPITGFSLLEGRNDFLDGEFTTFNHGDMIFVANPEEVISALAAANAPGAVDRAFDPLRSYTVEESTLSAYAQLDLDGEIAGRPFVGDVGVRLVHTSQDIGGFSQPFTIQFVGPIGEIVFTSPDVENISFSDDYTEILPSMNFRYELVDNLFLRLAASKSLTRAEFEDLAPSLSINSTQITATAGNPGLSPYDSTNVDLGLEYYFQETGVLAATVFHKQIDSFIAQTTNQNVTLLGTTFVTVVQPDNQGRAELTGLELTYQQPFGAFSPSLEDFGAGVNYTYIDNSAEFGDGSVLAFEGVSENSLNMFAYYDNGTFDARLAYSYRDDFLLLANDVFGQDVFQDAYGQLDFSASYDLTDNISIFGAAINITDENDQAYSVIEARPQIESKVGRRLEFGVSARF